MDSLTYHLKNSLGHLMGRTSRAIMGKLQKRFAAAGYSISVEQWLLLVNLRNADNQFHQQLADNTFKDKTTVTRLLHSLEHKGLARRCTGTRDRRQKCISITAQGKKLLRQLKPLALEVQRGALQDVAEHELAACRDVLLKIYGNVTKK